MTPPAPAAAGTDTTTGTATAGTAAAGTPRLAAGAVAGEDAYRRRFTWEQVTWATHCANCISTCSYRVYASGGGGALRGAVRGVPRRRGGRARPQPDGVPEGWGLAPPAHRGRPPPAPDAPGGRAGLGQWERISWDEALDAVADAVCDAVEEIGPQAVLVDESSEGGMLTVGRPVALRQLAWEPCPSTPSPASTTSRWATTSPSAASSAAPLRRTPSTPTWC